VCAGHSVTLSSANCCTARSLAAAPAPRRDASCSSLVIASAAAIVAGITHAIAAAPLLCAPPPPPRGPAITSRTLTATSPVRAQRAAIRAAVASGASAGGTRRDAGSGAGWRHRARPPMEQQQ
jgi:hypothetical protein